MIKNLKDLKDAIDFYIAQHGANYQVKPIDMFLSIGYSCPKNGWIVIREIEEVAQGSVQNSPLEDSPTNNGIMPAENGQHNA